jgi:hypothetical protein
MFTRIILALVSLMFTSMALATHLGVTLAVLPGSGGNTPFTALHTYYMSPTGRDSNNGTSAATAWATPNHALNCGDVIIAASGTYTGTFGSWGAVSNCPSTTGGIDGTGGVYFATLLCGGPDVASCNFTNSSGGKTFGVNASNWAIEGMNCNGGGNLNLCYNMSAVATSTTQLHHLAFINDLAVNSSQGYQEDDNTSGGENTNVPGNGADYFAYVGSICQNCGQSGYGVAGFNVVFPSQWDSNPGTHIFVDGNFSYNITTQSPDDGEDYMVDTPDKHGYAATIVESNNIGFGAARYCMAMTLDTYNTSYIANLKAYNFSCYGDGAAVPNTNAKPVAEFMFLSGGVLNRPVMTFTNNLAQTASATGDAGAVQLVALYEGYSGTFTALTMSGNWWDAIGTSCTSGAGTCVPATAPISAQFYPSNTASRSDTFGTAPGYTNVTDLLTNQTSIPNCTGFQTTVACMGYNPVTASLRTPSVISDLVPTTSGTAGKGYQLPSTTCAANADYPVWLKGVVYLQWNPGTATITENPGLVTKPCGL